MLDIINMGIRAFMIIVFVSMGFNVIVTFHELFAFIKEEYKDKKFSLFEKTED